VVKSKIAVIFSYFLDFSPKCVILVSRRGSENRGDAKCNPTPLPLGREKR
jgi:hypothetical protein